eukprot:TRINITY_DN231_c0_g2_i1.p1 TRINITY_DN231_c0_g2~~TRINITY_DN231_c0_g2_i1.p1  ORF type:complete len:934 (+),score=132.34 TRINITY_DN231_c0_g2_i1:24-2804(+)
MTLHFCKLQRVFLFCCAVLANNLAHASTRLFEGQQIAERYRGPEGRMKIDGNIGYAVTWQGIVVYDMTDADKPVVVGGYKRFTGLEERILLVELFGNDTLYMIGSRHVYALDRTDPSNLILKGYTELNSVGSSPKSVAIAENAMYIATTNVIIMDISNRFTPVYVDVVPFGSVETIFSSNYAFIRDSSKMTVIDLPTLANNWRFQTFAIIDDRGGVEGMSNAAEMRVYDSSYKIVTRTASAIHFFEQGNLGRMNYRPTRSLTSFDSTATIEEIDVDPVSNLLYVLFFDNRLSVYSLSEARPSLIVTHNLRTGGPYHGLQATAKGVFLYRDSQMYKLKPDGMLSDSYLPIPDRNPPRVHVVSEDLYVASISLGIDFFTSSRKMNGFFPYAHRVVSLANVGLRLYVAGPTEVFVIDISNLPYFNVLQRLHLPGVQNILIIENVMYLACGSRGLEMYDIGGPVMRRIGRYNTPNDAKAVAVSGTTAYIADGDSLQVLDVCEPSSPKFLAKLDIAGARDVEVSQSGLAAYVLAAGLVVVNVNTPASPVQTAVQSLLSDVAAMAIYGDDLFVTTDSSVLIRDISTPLAPTIVGSASAVEYFGRPFLHAAHGVLLVGAPPLLNAHPSNIFYGFSTFFIRPDAPASLSYDIGCFADYRALKSRSVAAYTPQQCFALCNTAGHTHAGTLFTSECWCGGASELAQSVRTNAADCATSGHRNMAVKSSVRFSHVGCFEDNVGRTAYVSAGMSVEHCAAYCGGDTVRNYKFFGIQKGDTCWCTQDIRSKPPAASGDCNAPCIGNGEAFCGGTFRSNMYALNSMDFTVGVVTASETYAESSHSFPIEVEYWDGSVQVVGSVAAPAQGSVHVMTATGILQHPRKVRIRAQGGDGWKVHAVTMTFAGSGANWLTDGVLGKVVKNTPGSEVVEWTAPPGSS